MSQSVAVASPVQDGKRGELFGGALTEEALDSSRSVLGAHRAGVVAWVAAVLHAARGGRVHQGRDRPVGAVAGARPDGGNGALLAHDGPLQTVSPTVSLSSCSDSR